MFSVEIDVCFVPLTDKSEQQTTPTEIEAISRKLVARRQRDVHAFLLKLLPRLLPGSAIITQPRASFAVGSSARIGY